MTAYRAAIWGVVFVEATALLKLMVTMGSIGGALFLLVATPALALLIFLSLIGHPGVGICLLLVLGFGCDVLWRRLAPADRKPVFFAIWLAVPLTGIATMAAICSKTSC